jgi:hypothetical protein
MAPLLVVNGGLAKYQRGEKGGGERRGHDR